MIYNFENSICMNTNNLSYSMRRSNGIRMICNLDFSAVYHGHNTLNQPKSFRSFNFDFADLCKIFIVHVSILKIFHLVPSFSAVDTAQKFRHLGYTYFKSFSNNIQQYDQLEQITRLHGLSFVISQQTLSRFHYNNHCIILIMTARM